MVHNVNKNTISNYRDNDMYGELLKLKKEGKIKHLEFSFHCDPAMFREDTPFGMETMLSSLGETIDCFADSCDSLSWKENYNILQIKQGNCAIVLSRKHRLSKKINYAE